MNLKGKILLIPDKADQERDAVAKAWRELGGQVTRLARFWDVPAFDPKAVHLYGGSSFSLIVAQKLGLKLISPADDWLLTLDSKWLKREIFCRTLEEIASVKFPVFVKPMVPKLFRAGIFDSSDDVANECKGLEAETRLLFSEIVHFRAEARAFVCEKLILDCRIYAGTGKLQEAEDFIQGFLQEGALPSTCVIDVGLVSNRGWAIVEANASWGAGLNGCDARRVIPAIASATRAGSEKDLRTSTL